MGSGATAMIGRMRKRDWEVIYDALSRRLAGEVDDSEGVTYDEYLAVSKRVAERLR